MGLCRHGNPSITCQASTLNHYDSLADAKKRACMCMCIGVHVCACRREHAHSPSNNVKEEVLEMTMCV